CVREVIYYGYDGPTSYAMDYW
nr:immunoglobulin heavy chain junction region [Mus musculus]